MGPGDIVADRFEIANMRARGGTGAVYRARDRTTGFDVALKIIGDVDDHVRSRFVREAVILGELSHPRIAGYVAHGALGDSLYLAMQWIDGQSLGDRVKQARLQPHEVVQILQGAAEGLAVVHARGIVHRDVKPGNLLLENGSVERTVVVDFGIARRIIATMVTPNGACVGTPGYMAPEQIRGESAIDPSADVFALGSVAYRCLAGKTAFAGGDVIATLAKVLFEEPLDIREHAPNVPQDMAALVMRMLAKDPRKRIPDATALLAELARLGGDVASVRSEQVPSLTHDEQRVFCAIAASLPEQSEASWAESVRVLREASAPFQGRFEPVAGGAVVIVLEPHGTIGEQAQRAQRLASVLVATGSAAAVGVAMGRGELGGMLPVGDVIDRAIGLLRIPGTGVRLDDTLSALLEPRGTPCVGRDRELRLIEGVLSEVIDDQVGRLLLVTGAAGMGKTRLLGELESRLGGRAQIWRIQGDDLGQGAPLSAIGACPQGAFLLALATKEGVLDWTARSDELRRVWVDHVRRATIDGPVAIVIDDAHLVDLASLKLIHAAMIASEELPVLVAAFGRSGVDEMFRAFTTPRVHIPLGELAPRALRSLARTLLPDEPDDVLDRFAGRASGNPLMLEELARAGRNALDRAPETVLSMMEARLERAGPEVRRFLRAASILGGTFDPIAVAAVAGGASTAEAARALEAARERDLVHAEAGAWNFRHALLRDAAYATLTARDREAGHGRAAKWLETRADVDAVRVAEHWHRASRSERATDHLVRAAERALAANDCDTAVAFADRGAAGASGAMLGRLHLLAAEALDWQGHYERARARAEQAIALLEKGSPHWHAACTEALVASNRLGDPDGVAAIAMQIDDAPPSPARTLALARAVSALVHGPHRGLGERLVALLEDGEQPLVRARVEEARANVALAQDDPARYVDRMRMVADAYRDAGAHRAACLTRLNLGHVLSSVGAFGPAVLALDAALETARELRVPFLSVAASHNLGLALAHIGRFDRAEEMERAAIEGAEQLGDARTAGASRVYLARILSMRGDVVQARDVAARAARELDAHPSLASLAHVVLAQSLLDEPQAALAALDRAGTIEEGDMLARLVRARALRTLGRSEEARAVVADARARIRERADRLGSLRADWLAMPENAALMDFETARG